jgi:predicted nucleotide-binding protein
VVEFIEKLGLKTVVLHGQLDTGQAAIEKYERSAAISEYAVVILTPDDMGATNDDPGDAKLRARQNVIFKLGYFCGVLGRARVSVLVKEDLKIPIDDFGIASIPMDPGGAWQFSLAKEMKSAGLLFDANRIFY